MPKGQPRKKGERVVKTAIDLPEALWRRLKIRALNERVDARSIIIVALERVLTPHGARRKGRRR